MNDEEFEICGWCENEYKAFKDHAGFCSDECGCDFGRSA